MKKILYIWKGQYPFEIRIQKICESLVKLGYEVTVLCRWNYEDIAEDIINGVRVIRTGFKQNLKLYLPIPYNLFWKKAINKVVAESKPDLIINREFYLLTETIAIAHQMNIPVIVDMAENYPAALREFQHSQTAFKQFLFRTLEIPDIYEKFIVPKADGVIVVCDEQIPRLQSIGVKAEDISVVHNTPLLDSEVNFRASANELSHFRFIHHGYLSGDKSILPFIKGFLLLCQTRSDIDFIIAGTGECFEKYKKEISNHPFADRIKLLGYYNIGDLNSIIAKADIGVLPFATTDFNNFTIQNKIFDYFANSTPVLVSLCHPLKRVIEETKAGLALDCSTPESCAIAIETMINNLNPEMPINAYTAYKNKYNWQNDEKTLCKFIERFI